MRNTGSLAGIGITALGLVGTLLATGVAQAQDYESAPVVAPSSILPEDLLKGPEHRVYGQANGRGMQYSYNLWTPFGDYTPGSTDMLMIRIQEARAMQQLRGDDERPAVPGGYGGSGCRDGGGGRFGRQEAGQDSRSASPWVSASSSSRRGNASSRDG